MLTIYPGMFIPSRGPSMASLQCHSQVVAVVLRQGTIHVDRQLWALPPETAPIFGGIHSHEINEYFDAG